MLNQIIKRLFVFTVVLTWGIQGFAQVNSRGMLNYPEYSERKLHYGFVLGGVLFLSDVDHFPETEVRDISSSNAFGQPAPGVGFLAALVIERRLTYGTAFRTEPGVSFGSRSYEYTFPVDSFHVSGSGFSITSTYVNLPFFVKTVVYRNKNFTPYLIGGLNFMVDVSKKDEAVPVARRRVLAFISAGIGLDFSLPFFRMSCEFSWDYGMLPMTSTRPGFEKFHEQIEEVRPYFVNFKLKFE